MAPTTIDPTTKEGRAELRALAAAARESWFSSDDDHAIANGLETDCLTADFVAAAREWLAALGPMLDRIEELEAVVGRRENKLRKQRRVYKERLHVNELQRENIKALVASRDAAEARVRELEDTTHAVCKGALATAIEAGQAVERERDRVVAESYDLSQDRVHMLDALRVATEALGRFQNNRMWPSEVRPIARAALAEIARLRGGA